MVTLLLSLLDDQFFYGRRKQFTKWTFIEKVINILIYGAVLLALVKLYSLKLNGTIVESNIGNLILNINNIHVIFVKWLFAAFSKDQFENVLKQGITITIYLGLISLGITALRALSSALFDTQGSKVSTVISTLLYSAIAGLLFLASAVCFFNFIFTETKKTTISKSTRSLLFPPSF